jgi:hypothetical protein
MRLQSERVGAALRQIAVPRFVVGTGHGNRIDLRLNRRREDETARQRSRMGRHDVVGRGQRRSDVDSAQVHKLRRPGIRLRRHLFVRADPQPERTGSARRNQLVQRLRKRQRHAVRFGEVLDRRRLVNDVVGIGGRVGRVDQLVVVRVRRRDRVQVVVVEIHFDLAARLAERPGSGAEDGLRHHAQNPRAQVQLELQRKIHAVVDAVVGGVAQRETQIVPQRIRTGARHVDPVQIVRQTLGKAENHFARRAAQPHVTGRHRHVVGAAQDQRRVVDRRGRHVRRRRSHAQRRHRDRPRRRRRVEHRHQLARSGLVPDVRVQLDPDPAAVQHRDPRTGGTAAVHLGKLDADPVGLRTRLDRGERDIQVPARVEIRARLRHVRPSQPDGRIGDRRCRDRGVGRPENNYRLDQPAGGRVVVDRSDQVRRRRTEQRVGVQFDVNLPALDPHPRQPGRARIALGEHQRNLVAHRPRRRRLELHHDLAARVEVRARRRRRELAVSPRSRHQDRSQRRLVNRLALVEPERQLLRRHVANGAFRQQITAVWLHPYQLGAYRQKTPVLQALQPQSSTSTELLIGNSFLALLLEL